MIKFFRNIRKSLINEGKTGKYLKYALGEIILVVLGILIALQINNWNENRKGLHKRSAYTKSLLKELQQDTTDFRKNTEIIEKELEILKDFHERLKLESATIDTMKQIARFEFRIHIDNKKNYNDKTLKALQSSGDIQLYPKHIQNLMLELTATQEEYNDIIELYLADYLHATQAQNLLATKPEQYNFFGINDNFKSKTWDAMDDVRIREGVMISHFDMLTDLQWAMRRGGVGSSELKKHLTVWGTMLYPATPHMAEEWNSYLGNKITLAETIIDDPNVDEDDVLILAEEGALKNLIDSARNVKGLAERHSEKPVSRLVIQTTPDWKRELLIEALDLADSEFDFMREGTAFIQQHAVFADEAKRGEVMQYWRALTIGSKKTRGRVFTLRDSEKALIRSKHDETASIKAAISFIADAINIKSIEVYVAGEGEDISGKARFAAPLLPGLAFL